MTHKDVYINNENIFSGWHYTLPSLRVVSLPGNKEELSQFTIYKEAISVKDTHPFDRPTEIKIIEGDAIGAAMELKNQGLNPAIHNFANGYYPCGLYAEGFNGMEEDLCRRTTLSLSLENAESHYPLALNYGGIYSTACVFRKSESEDFELIESPSLIHVVSVPALNLRNGTNHKRIVQNLEYARHGEDALTE